MNKREQAIKEGYLAELERGYTTYLTRNNKWVRGKIKKGGNKTVWISTPDGLTYKANQQYIERKFL